MYLDQDWRPQNYTNNKFEEKKVNNDIVLIDHTTKLIWKKSVTEMLKLFCFLFYSKHCYRERNPIMYNLLKKLPILGFFVICFLTISNVGIAQLVAEISTVKSVTSGNSAAFGDEIRLEVENRNSILTEGKGKNIIPYLDAWPLTGINAVPVPKIPGKPQEEMTFILESEKISKDSWKKLIGKPGFFTLESIAVSIGVEGEVPKPTSANINLKVIGKYSFIFVIVLILLVFALLVWFAITTDMLRDPGPRPEKGPGVQKTYSLARMQMAFWFFLVISAFLYIWLITGKLVIINSSILALIGISAGTYLGAVIIDSNKRDSIGNTGEAIESEKQKLLAKMETIEIRLKEIDAIGGELTPEVEQEKKNLSDSKKELEQKINDSLDKLKGMATEGILKDLLTDTNGITLHRFQMFVWTIVLGIFFISKVYTNLEMPDLQTMLGLMGISGATYIGFKFPEKQTDEEKGKKQE